MINIHFPWKILRDNLNSLESWCLLKAQWKSKKILWFTKLTRMGNLVIISKYVKYDRPEILVHANYFNIRLLRKCTTKYFTSILCYSPAIEGLFAAWIKFAQWVARIRGLKWAELGIKWWVRGHQGVRSLGQTNPLISFLIYWFEPHSHSVETSPLA